MKSSLCVALTVAGILATPIHAQNDFRLRYALKMKMYDGERLVAEPKLEIAAGEGAEIAIEDGKGASYHAMVSVEALENGTLAMSSEFVVASPTTGKISASPRLVLRDGETGTVEFGSNAGTLKPFRAELTFDRVGK